MVGRGLLQKHFSETFVKISAWVVGLGDGAGYLLVPGRPATFCIQ